MNNILVSVIIPVYNSQEYISKCLKSIQSQSYTNLEIICIDDGSIDNSVEIIENLMKHDNRINLIKQKNNGAARARNIGISNLSGDYVLFIDSDDYIESMMIEVMIKEAINYNVEMVITGMTCDYFNKSGILIKSKKNKIIPRIVSENSNICESLIDLFQNESINGPCGKLIKSKILLQNNIFMPEGIHLQEDLYFNIQILKNIKKISVLDRYDYHYCHRINNSVTNRYYDNRYEMLNFVHNELISYFLERTNNKWIIEEIYFLYIKNIYSSLLNLFHKECLKNRREKIKYIEKIVNSTDFNEKIKFASNNRFKKKLLLLILKLKNSYIIYYFSMVLFFLRKKLKINY